jgi:acyl-CoA reductase-like NAD-dependent aldehyde dehydrogenase
VAKAVAFGLRLNGGAVCMSPRRLFATPASMAKLKPLLEAELALIPPVALDARTAERLEAMLTEATGAGAKLHGTFDFTAQRPLVLSAANAQMAAESLLHAMDQYAQCPYALTAAIFCGRADEKRARATARMLKAGTVLINDIIAPTADPRVPFGGRGASGYGVTRGAEGLLEMTAVKTVLLRRGRSTRHMQPAGETEAELFGGLIEATHGSGIAARWAAVKRVMKAVRR